MVEELIFEDTMLNPNKRVVEQVRGMLMKTNGYCPCHQEVEDIEDTKCPCKKYRNEYICCCTLYVPK